MLLFNMHFTSQITLSSPSVPSTTLSIQRRAAECGRWLWLVVKDLVDLSQYFRRKLRKDLERLEVVKHLLRPGSAEDDSRRAGV
jgi:hypothetical protein